jgi:CRISPR/Cas system CMR subunit Cmr4 (Cas7 group RAMP superfamily)
MKHLRFLMLLITLNVVVAAPLTLSSCKALALPSKNATLLADVEEIDNAVNSLYDRVIVSNDKRFATYESDYSDIDLKIAYIVDVNKTRNKAGNILKQAELLQKNFAIAEDDHRSRSVLSNKELKTHKDYIHAFIKPILVSELSLK